METNREDLAETDSPRRVDRTQEEIELWTNLHRDLVEWMTEGTSPYLPPRSDHG